jgi:hypothetical protein
MFSIFMTYSTSYSCHYKLMHPWNACSSQSELYYLSMQWWKHKYLYEAMQINGVPQGDLINPLLSSIRTADMVKEIRHQDHPITLNMYTD